MKEMDLFKQNSTYQGKPLCSRVGVETTWMGPCCYQPAQRSNQALALGQEQMRKQAACGGYCATCDNYIC